MDLGSSSGHGSLSYKKKDNGDVSCVRPKAEKVKVRSKACSDINGCLLMP